MYIFAYTYIYFFQIHPNKYSLSLFCFFKTHTQISFLNLFYYIASHCFIHSSFSYYSSTPCVLCCLLLLVHIVFALQNIGFFNIFLKIWAEICISPSGPALFLLILMQQVIFCNLWRFLMDVEAWNRHNPIKVRFLSTQIQDFYFHTQWLISCSNHVCSWP